MHSCHWECGIIMPDTTSVHSFLDFKCSPAPAALRNAALYPPRVTRKADLVHPQAHRSPLGRGHRTAPGSFKLVLPERAKTLVPLVCRLVSIVCRASMLMIGLLVSVTPLTGPNGSINWLNCGVNTTGWNPAYVNVNSIVTRELSAVLADDNSPFAPCTPYLDLFNKYSRQYGSRDI